MRSLLGLAALAWSAQAGTVYSNGTPDFVNGNSITHARTADNFTLGAAATLTAVRFWFSVLPGQTSADFNGSITYAFYNNNSGALGATLASATASGLTPVYSGSGLSVCSVAPCPVYQLDFNLAAALALNAGTYWLELHHGADLTTGDAPANHRIYWSTSATSGGSSLYGTGPDYSTIPNPPSSPSEYEYAFQLFDASAAAVPEPSTLVLTGAGAACALLLHRRR